jgi:putative transcriptional regulator
MMAMSPPVRRNSSSRRSLARLLCALLILLQPFFPTSADDSSHLTAILLTARSALPDPDFADAVVLVLNNLGPAPIGVIVNRPTQVSVAELFPDLKRLAHVHEKIFFGGPVELDTVWFLFRAAKPPEHAIQTFGDTWLSADRPLLLTLLGRDKPMDGLRIFVGHSGWAPGQLEAEIENGDWTLGHADPDAIFKSKSNHPWPSSQTPKPGT